MAVVALLTAGGVGTRMNQDIPKQFLTINEKPVIIYTLEAFQKHPEVDTIAVVCLDGWENILSAYAKQFNITKLKFIVSGGKNGQESIRNGVFELEKHYDSNDIVLIHDGNRPLVTQEIICDCLRITRQYGNAITAIPCVEAILQTDDGFVSSVCYPREQLRRTQTPQGFKIGDICNLHRRAQERGLTNSVASCTLMIEMGEQVHFSEGSEKNIKLTTLEDVDIFKALLVSRRMEWLKE